MAKLTFDEVMQRLADERPVRREDVRASVLRRKVWVYGHGQPGCLYDYGPCYSRTKKDAVEELCWIADIGEGVPRGMRAALLRDGTFWDDCTRYELSQDTLASLL